MLSQGKEETQRAELFEFEHLEAMFLGDLPDLLREYPRRYDLRQSVEEVGDDPIEHLHREWEFLENAAVDVVCEA